MTERSRSPLVHVVASLLVVASVGLLVGRILTVAGPFGANDVSRWATVRALVEQGTLSIGRRVPLEGGGYRDEGIVVEPGWRSVDVALDPDTALFYSSKPPLLSILVAGEVWLLEHVFGWTLATDPGPVLRAVLLTFNALPLALALLLLAGLLLERGGSDAGRLFAVACASFATFAPAFGIVLTNHVPAFAACAIALVALAHLARGSERRARWSLVAGLSSGVAAALEPPALCLVGLALIVALRFDRRRALTVTLPAALAPLALFFWTTALAFGDPLFFHHRDNRWDRFLGSYQRAPEGIDAGGDGPLSYALHFLFGHHGFFSLTPVLLLALPPLLAPLVPRQAGRLSRAYPALYVAVFVALSVLGRVLHRDVGLPLVVGLVPPLLSSAGAALLPLGWWRERFEEEWLPRLALLASSSVLAFYIVKTKNYGGETCGPRWVLWLVPLWLALLPGPVSSLLEDPRKRLVAFALLGLSALSVAWGFDTPWRSPWLHALFR